MSTLTPTEARDTLLRLIAERIEHWAGKPNLTPRERCTSVASEIICMIDGTTTALPALDLVLPTGEVINPAALHPA